MATLALLTLMRSTEKHPNNPLATEQRFLNFGALALATYCTTKAHSAKVFDEYALQAQNIIKLLTDSFGNHGPDAIGLSCISAYSADRAKRLIADLKEAFPAALIMVGGQHFAAFWKGQFTTKMPGTHLLISGEAEVSIVKILDLLDQGFGPDNWTEDAMPDNVWWLAKNAVRSGKTRATVVRMDEIAMADYHLYEGSRSLFPSIEYSRGCQYACVFCANTSHNRRNFRDLRKTACDFLGGWLELGGCKTPSFMNGCWG